jgi:hypothetical protein
VMKTRNNRENICDETTINRTRTEPPITTKEQRKNTEIHNHQILTNHSTQSIKTTLNLNMSKYNRIPNQPKTERIVLRVTESEKNNLTRMAFNQNKTISRIILESIKTKSV